MSDTTTIISVVVGIVIAWMAYTIICLALKVRNLERENRGLKLVATALFITHPDTDITPMPLRETDEE